MNAFLKAISYYLPKNGLSNESISIEFPDWSVEKISSKVGISNRKIAAEDEFVSDMAVQASQRLFSEYGISPNEIDYLILCTQSPDYFLPATACVVQNRLGIPTSAGAIDINQGCSGFVYGLSMAKGLIATGDFNNILLITAETYSKYIHPLDKGNRTIFGDAAAAVLITSSPHGGRIGRFILGSDGNGANNLIVKRGGARFPKSADLTYNEAENDHSPNENFLYMNGSEIFNFTIDAVPKLVANTLERNNLTDNDIDLYIFHQANRFMLQYLRKKLKIEDDRFYIFMENCGNTVSSTIPIALKNAQIEKKVQPGSKVLLAGFGVGYSWGGTVIEF